MSGATIDAAGHVGHRRGYEYGLLDTAAKKEIRRTCLKALCLPGYLVPFASREMPIARGFGTGGLQITLSIIGPSDVLKVIDQGADECVNACSMRKLIGRVCPGVRETTRCAEATIVQTRHRIPETELGEGQVLVLQVPYCDPLYVVEPRDTVRERMHGETDYARLYVKLYEDLVQFDEITISHRYPTKINGHYIMDPSPIPRWDVPRLHMSRNMNLFGAGREKKIYAVPAYTRAEPLEFDDVPFRVEGFPEPGVPREVAGRLGCYRCGAKDTYLDELYLGDGRIVHACSDTEHCELRQADGGRVSATARRIAAAAWNEPGKAGGAGR